MLLLKENDGNFFYRQLVSYSISDYSNVHRLLAIVYCNLEHIIQNMSLMYYKYTNFDVTVGLLLVQFSFFFFAFLPFCCFPSEF